MLFAPREEHVLFRLLSLPRPELEPDAIVKAYPEQVGVFAELFYDGRETLLCQQ